MKKKVEECILYFHYNGMLGGIPGRCSIIGFLVLLLITAGINCWSFTDQCIGGNLILSGIVILLISVSLICFRKNNYLWFLYRFCFTMVICLDTFVLLTIIVQPASTEYYAEMIIAFLACGMIIAVVQFVIIHNRLFNECHTQEWREELNGEFTFAGAGVFTGVISIKLFGGAAIVVTAGLCSILLIYPVPYIIFFIYSKKYHLSEDILYRNREIQIEEKRIKEQKRIDEEGPFKF